MKESSRGRPSGPASLLGAAAVVAALAACSFRGGDHAPLVKPPSTPCSLEAEAFCKEQLTSEDPSTCIARETYRCEIREEAAKRAAETKETAPGPPPP